MGSKIMDIILEKWGHFLKIAGNIVKNKNLFKKGNIPEIKIMVLQIACINNFGFIC